MPTFVELQRRTRSQIRILEARGDYLAGEETLVIDDRSRRSCVRAIEEKLESLTQKMVHAQGRRKVQSSPS